MTPATDPAHERAEWDAQWRNAETGWFEAPAFVRLVADGFTRIHPLEGPVLDVGCGRSVFAAYIKDCLGLDVVGTDFSLSSLRHGFGPRVQADARALPFREDAFRSVTGLLLLEHIPDYDVFLGEARRVLAPGGRLYLLFPNRRSAVLPGLMLKKVAATLKRTRHRIPHHAPLSVPSVHAALECAGFRVLGTDYLSIGPFRGIVDRLVSGLARILLPKRFGEEILIVAEKMSGD